MRPTRGLLTFAALLGLGTEYAECRKPPPPLPPPPPDPTCPADMFVQRGFKEKHRHCVCPEGAGCVGCTRGCSGPLFKFRCVQGFKPDCTNCSCGEHEGGSLDQFGLLLDRRKLGYCNHVTATPKQ